MPGTNVLFPVVHTDAEKGYFGYALSMGHAGKEYVIVAPDKQGCIDVMAKIDPEFTVNVDGIQQVVMVDGREKQGEDNG